MTRRRLDTELVRRGLVRSRGEAKAAIDAGTVTIAGMPAGKASTLVDEEVPILLVERGRGFVSRGGHKLAAALEAFPVTVEGKRCLDVGASTGGFTDCLLQSGAASVTAVDVGYGQIAWSIRTDPRVRVVERTNIRHAVPRELGAPFDLIVADLSFISLCTVSPVLAECGAEHTEYIVLVKPQFEAGRKQVGKGGIVRDRRVRLRTVEKVIACFSEVGLGGKRVIRSPLEGANGNVEFLLWARPGPVSIDLTIPPFEEGVSYNEDP